MKKASLLAIFLAIVSLACVQSASVGSDSPLRQDEPTLTQTTTLEPEVMTVAAFTLNVRDAPGGTVIPDFWLRYGQDVTIHDRKPDEYNNEWCRISAQYDYWVACWWLEE